MIDLEGHGLNTPLRITERHLPGVAQQSESRNVRHCMNWSCSPCLVLYSLQRFGRRAVQFCHRDSRRLKCDGCYAVVLQGR